MSTTHERTTSCGTSCFIMVTLIWAVFHAIPSPQGVCHTEAPGVVTAVGLGAQRIPSRENEKALGEKNNISDVPKTVMAVRGPLLVPVR